MLKRSANPEWQEQGFLLEQLKSKCDTLEERLNEDYRRGWNKIDPEDVVCADSKTLASALAKLQKEKDMVYIRGHCEAGSKVLQSSDRHETITVEGLIGILKGKLERKFPGKIKIFACESSLDTVDSESFAKSFATSLSGQGWINCTFYGYREELKTFIQDVNGQKTSESGTRASKCREFIQVPTQRDEGAPRLLKAKPRGIVPFNYIKQFRL